jgi:hypothetical protein
MSPERKIHLQKTCPIMFEVSKATGFERKLPLKCIYGVKCDWLNCKWKDDRIIQNDEAVISHFMIVDEKLKQWVKDAFVRYQTIHPQG